METINSNEKAKEEKNIIDLWLWYSKDINFVYYEKYKIPWVDTKTFKIK